LGLADFDSAKISETDKKIFTQFYAQIIKYRSDNNLPEYSSERLDEGKVFLSEKKDICRYLSCPKAF
jgi:hypothetical protein